jgi:imidazoleglycerol phosphate synthase glutamine amidotransferase subunit HisH
MILVINVSSEKLYYYEFVKPILDILKKGNINFFVKKCSDVNSNDLDKAEKVIICGTGLLDNGFLERLDCFNWLVDFEKPVLGICAGMHIIGLVFGCELRKKCEIGFYFLDFINDFLGLEGFEKAYLLHNYYADFSSSNLFSEYCLRGLSSAVKHNYKEIYGVLFHPEVLNKNMVLKFSKK